MNEDTMISRACRFSIELLFDHVWNGTAQNSSWHHGLRDRSNRKHSGCVSIGSAALIIRISES